MKDKMAKARRKRAKPLFQAAHASEKAGLDLQALRAGTMLTPTEKAVLLRAEEMLLKAGNATRKVALRLHEARRS